MKRFLICLTVVFMALAFVNCKTESGVGSGILSGAGKATLLELLGKGKGKTTEPLGDLDTEYHNYVSNDLRTWLAREMPDKRIAYGNDAYHFGDLRLAKNDKLKTAAGYPVLVVIHGGAWRVSNTIWRTDPLAEAFADFGIITWNIEFRRLATADDVTHIMGGGYPGTLRDIGAAIDYLRVLAPEYDMDLDRVSILCHSSGGQLGVWAAGRHKLPADSPLYVADPLPIKGVVNLGGIMNMQGAYEGGRADMLVFIGVSLPNLMIPVLPTVSPYQMLPIDVPTSHFVGSVDDAWRINGIQQYAEKSIELGTPSHVFIAPGANEFDITDPCAPSWPNLVEEVFWAMDEQLPAGDFTKSKFCPLNK